MITVSDAWKAAHTKTLLPETFIEITYSATDPNLSKSATVDGELIASFADVTDVVADGDKTGEKYATLEQGLWGLDGTYGYRPASENIDGYISSVLSGEDCRFTEIPTVSITFPTTQTALIPGVTITWSETYSEWATEFSVIAYRGGTQVAGKVISNNTSPTTILWLDMERYDEIRIFVYAWSLPYHRARVADVVFGIQTVYQKTDLMGYEHTQSADLLSAALPKNEITFKLRNDDGRWNPDNPTGSEQYLLERQEIRVRYGMAVDDAIEWIEGGTFWLSEWDTPSNGLEASFTARDAVEFMRAEYTGPRSGTLYDIAVAAFEQADLALRDDGSVRYFVHNSLGNITTDFTASTEAYTIAEILQMVAHAGNCVFWQDRFGVVNIAPWSGANLDYWITQDISYTHPEYNLNKPLKAISVNYGDKQNVVVAVADRGEIQTVDNIMVRTYDDAVRVANRAQEILTNRKVITGDFRADIRLDALDPIIVTSKYATNLIAVTDIKYATTGGAFKGTYTGRVVSVNLKPEDRRSGEFYAGEV